MLHIDWIYQLQIMDSTFINEKMGEYKYAFYYLFLIDAFYMNSNLLSKICNSYINCISCINEKVLYYFIIQCDIGKQIQCLILNKDIRFGASSKYCYHKPYTVFLIKLAHKVNDCSVKDEIKKYLEHSVEWQNLFKNEFAFLNEIYSKPISG